MRERIDPHLGHVRITGKIISRVEQRMRLESGSRALRDVMDQRMILRNGMGVFLAVISGVEKRVGIAVLLSPQRCVMGQKTETLPLEIRILFEIISGIEQQRPFDQEVIPQEPDGLTDLKRPDPRNERQCPTKHQHFSFYADKYFFCRIHILKVSSKPLDLLSLVCQYTIEPIR